MGLTAMIDAHDRSLIGRKWIAKVTYQSDQGSYKADYTFDDPEELRELIEAAQEPHRLVEVEIAPVDTPPGA